MSVFDGFKPFEDSRKISSVVRINQVVMLSDYLAERFTYRSREAWLNEIKAGRFLLNNERISDDCTIENNTELVYEFAAKDEPECDLNYRLLGADENFICVVKSGNLPTHPAGRYYKNTLWYLLQRDFGACAPVSRLDRETSGVLLFARNPQAARFFSQNPMQKKYQLIVHGEFPEYLDGAGFIMNDKQSLIRKKRRFSFTAPTDGTTFEDCRTIFRRLQFKNGFSLLEAQLESGRTHQIRATCCSLGFPLAGDKMYGIDENFFLRYIDGKLTASDREKLIYDRQALHSYSLSFKNPSDGEIITFSSPMELEII